jgi:hypothetical protein
MSYQVTIRTFTRVACFATALLAAQTGLYAQGGGRGGGRGGRGGRGGAPATAQAAAPVDLTGYWVSVVTEDWRYRMVTPAKGDFQGVPMNAAAVKVADEWDPAKEQASGDQCKSYGAPALLRVPNRLHITWADDNTLKLESDAGKQTRMFHFGDWKSPGGPPTLQGDSVAEWDMGGRGGRGGRGGGGGRGGAAAGPPPTDGSLKVVTTNLKGGFLRKNGVPYSDKATLTEYFDLITEPDGTPLIVVTIDTADPVYLTRNFVISSQYKKEPDGAKWKPSECSAIW